MKSEKSNKHEKSESKSYERMEKKMKTEPEYQKGKGALRKNYKGKMC
jgi:hypothetical protein